MQHLALSIVFNVFLFGPVAPPGIVRRKWVFVLLCFCVCYYSPSTGFTQIKEILQVFAHQVMFLFFAFSWTTSSVLRPRTCGSPVTPS